ncbi:MAG TPA: MobF family relaxase [Steroidobacteraceae bacterium]|nr:MobF family relaxase [Steroidobacteraceae bacterium]
MALARNITARHAATYYEMDDYYTRDRSPSEWHGEGARALGLSGPVDREVFANLVEGRIPGGPTLHRGGGPRRGGTDFEFSAPKSFSVQALVNGDRRLLDVHRTAVAIARGRIEATVATRVTEQGATRLEFTRAPVIAQFEHATSRAGDPDLHSHVVVLNLTRRVDGQWRSIENAEMFNEQRLMYETYLSELAKGAKDLGYGITVGKHGNPELAHITRGQIEHFSRRSRQVEAELESGGQTRETSTAAAKRTAALSTREPKQEYDHAALRTDWMERGRQVGLLEYRLTEEPHLPALTERQSAEEAVRFAVEHLSERQAAFTQRDVLVQALRAGRAAAASGAISAELDRQISSGELVHDASGQWLTTGIALEAEERVLSIEREGREAVSPIAMTTGSAEHTPGLNAGQRSLVNQVLSTRNRVIGINGLAGTGKTTALNVARDLAEREGFEFVGLAPSHSAVRALKKSGIASQTVQRWLLDRNAGSKLTLRSIVVLDEAGLAGTTTLRAVLERIERAGARAVLVGDVNQYESVEAGRAFAQLQEHGMQTVELSEMIRQRDATLAEAARLSVRYPGEALQRLPVIEEKDTAARHARIAGDFVALSASDRVETLVLTGSHEARRDINERIRAKLRLRGSGERIRVFQALDKTAAQKKQLETYEPGLTLRFEKDYRSLGASRGDTAQVERVLSDALMVRLSNGTGRTLSLGRLSGKGWSVGVVEELEVAPGERVRFTGTNPRAGFRNGERGIVEEISAEALTIRRPDGNTVRLPAGHVLSLDYSYAMTGHSAQGLDASRVVLEKDTHSRTTSHRSFYTDLTRARDAAVVMTDSSRRLRQRVRPGERKPTALEVGELSERAAARGPELGKE